MSTTSDIPGWEGTIGPSPSQYGAPHVYARDVHSGAGNCVCGRALRNSQHVQAAPGVPIPAASDPNDRSVLAEVAAERIRQDKKWGEQNHPDGTGPHAGHEWAVLSKVARDECQEAARRGKCTWLLILREEVYEAFAEDDPAKLREELVQVAAVATQWVEAIDRRTHLGDQ